METPTPQALTRLEQLLIAIGTSPWDAVQRVAIGFVTLPAWRRLWSAEPPGWVLVPFLLAVLLMLRLVPAAIRGLLPFPDPVRRVWFERRQIAKRYDSYQWKKLFWIGLGLASYTAFSGQFAPSSVAVSSICLLSGALGLARWRAVAPRREATGLRERAI
jgi:hypothetical protein